MVNLVTRNCEPCNGDVPPLSNYLIRKLRTEVPGWTVIRQGGTKKLFRQYLFDDFQEGLLFTSHIGRMAEIEKHHPEIFLTWGKVEVTWWTHKTGGLHENDFIMAAKTDRLFKSYQN